MQNSNNIPHTLGIIETVDLPELGVFSERAKVDTGAYSGSIHCHSIERVKNSEGKVILRVIPIDTSYKPVEFTKFKETHATSSTGHRVHRYIVKTPICINDKTYTISIGLATRDTLKSKILIGRRFLRKYNLLVDVTKNQELDDDGGRKL